MPFDTALLPPSVNIGLGPYKRVLNHVSNVALFLTSPPYNIGSKCPRRSGMRKNGLYDPKSFAGVDGYPDAMDEADYQDSQVEFLEWCADRMDRDGTLVYNHKPRRRNKAIIHPLTWIFRVPRLALVEEIVWDRGSGHNHDRTQMWPQTERLYVLRLANGEYSLKNNTLAGNLPQRTDVWRIGRSESLGHCAAFPPELAEAAIKAWSKPGQLVVDPYSGSGTTAVAAKRLGRRFEGAELLEKYHAISMERLCDER